MEPSGPLRRISADEYIVMAAHYIIMNGMNTPSTPDEIRDRFWARVDKSAGEDACWPWTGCRNKQTGYGIVNLGNTNKHIKGTHVASWIFTHGEPGSKHVLHSCDNRPCCNPKHLFLGTNLDNVRDMIAKGRNAKGDKSGNRTKPERRPRGEKHWTKLHPEWLVRLRKPKKKPPLLSPS